jgi:RNA polymerase primary sigma factor
VSVLAADPRANALHALRKAAEHGPLSFPAVAKAVQAHGLPAADVAALLRELEDAGIGLPPALAAVPTPARPAPPHLVPAITVPSPRTPVRLLRGDEVLDTSRISLADLGSAAAAPPPQPSPLPSPPSRNRPRRPVEEFVWDEDYREPRHPPLDLLTQYRAEIGREPLLTAEEEVRLGEQIEAGLLARKDLSRTDLPAEAMRDLRRLAESGQQAFDRFVRANLRLVVSIAKSYRGRGLDILDLIQEGNLGLIRAVQKFDYQRGFKFSTYASWWIKQSITRALADHGRTIRYPVHVVERLDKVEAAVARLAAAGREPTAAAVAAASEFPEDEVQRLLALPQTVPLDAATDALGEERVQDLTDRYRTPAADPQLLGYDAEDVHAALSQLSEREQFVLRRRAGFDGDPATLEEIGQDLGVTRERIRQIEAKARSKVVTRLRAVRAPVLRKAPEPA